LERAFIYCCATSLLQYRSIVITRAKDKRRPGSEVGDKNCALLVFIYTYIPPVSHSAAINSYEIIPQQESVARPIPAEGATVSISVVFICYGKHFRPFLATGWSLTVSSTATVQKGSLTSITKLRRGVNDVGSDFTDVLRHDYLLTNWIFGSLLNTSA
jgi:hypothetical protein